MSDSLRVLIVDDSLEFCQIVRDLLDLTGGFELQAVHTLKDMWPQLADGAFDAMLLDNHLPDGTGLEVLPRLMETGDPIPVVMVTGEGDQLVASEAIKRGAYDYIVKGDVGLTQLAWVVRRAIHLYRTRKAGRQAEQRAFYQAWLLNNVGDAIVAVDDVDRISYWNNGAEALFGPSQEDVLGKPVAAVFSDSAFKDTGPLLTLLTGGKGREEFRIQRLEADPVWIHVRIHKLKDREGFSSGRVGIFQNINARKMFEQRYNHAQTRLIHAARLSALGELASNLAHEINNPLTTILGEAQILKAGLPAGTESGEAARAIEQAGWRAADFVSQLINLSNPAEEAPRPVALNVALEKAMAYLQNQLSTSAMALSVTFPPDLPHVMAQERDLTDIWINVLTYVLEAAGQHVMDVDVTAQHKPPMVSMDVAMPRSGSIRPGDRRGSLVPRDLLGLAVAEEMTRSLGGRLSFIDDQGDRTIIRLELPAMENKKPEP